MLNELLDQVTVKITSKLYETETGLEQDFERNIIKQGKNQFFLSHVPVPLQFSASSIAVLSQPRPSSIKLSSYLYCIKGLVS